MKNLKKIFSLLIQSPYPLEMQPVLIKNIFKIYPSTYLIVLGYEKATNFLKQI